MEQSAADLRAAIARANVPIYHVASRVGLHPSVFSLYLHDRRPIPDALAQAVAEGLTSLRAEPPQHRHPADTEAGRATADH
jgi:hypothetical protein